MLYFWQNASVFHLKSSKIEAESAGMYDFYIFLLWFLAQETLKMWMF